MSTFFKNIFLALGFVITVTSVTALASQRMSCELAYTLPIVGVSNSPESELDSAFKNTQVSPDRSSLIKLLKVDSSRALPEIVKLTATLKNPKATPRQRSIAAKAIELLSLSSVSVSAADLQLKKTRLAWAIDLSIKVAALDYNVAARDFYKAYRVALGRGFSPDQAIRVAGDGKITLEQFESCSR